MRISVAAAVASLILGSVSMADEVRASIKKPIDIPAQSLGAALQALAKDRDIQIVYFSSKIDLLETAGARGDLTTDEVLAAMLANTGLSYRYLDDKTVTIVPLATAPSNTSTSMTPSDDLLLRLADATAGSAERGSRAGSGSAAKGNASPATSVAAEEVEPEEVVVKGVRFYQPERGRAASKMDLPLLETPLSVSIVTSEQIEARAADSLEQAFRYSAGIYSLSGGANRRAVTGFVVRGFNITGSGPLYVNGSKFPINSVSGAMEPYLYESVELLKGPASVLYGQAAPGGIINMVSKRPTAVPLHSVRFQTGSWDNKQVSADFGGPLTEDGQWSYRLTGLGRDSGSMIDRVPDDRAVLSSALKWSPSADTALTFLATYHRTHTMYDPGKPFEGTVLPNPNGRISREVFVGEPGFDKFNPTGRTLGYLFEHRFNDVWQVRQNLLWFDYDVDYAAVALQARVDSTNRRLANRYAYTRDDSDKGWSVDNQLLAKWDLGRFEHTALLGVDYSEHKFARAQALRTIGTWDIFNPVYGQAIITLPNPNLSATDSSQVGLYFQDHIKLDQRWIAMLGGRWDKTKADDSFTPAGGVAGLTKTTADAFTKRVGLMYLSDRGIAPYLSYSESFQPVAGTDFSGKAFNPTAGVQYEAGIKLEPRGRNAALTLAAFQLTQENVLTADLAHLGSLVQTGEVRSRGIEVEGRVSFGEALDVIASYGSADAEITKSNGADLGRTPAAVPDSTASLWLDYHYRVGTGGELSFGAGARYVGRSMDPANVTTVPTYTDYDLSMRYDLAKWRFAFNVKNLLDKAYVSSCPFTCTYGDARNVTVSAQYTW